MILTQEQLDKVEVALSKLHAGVVEAIITEDEVLNLTQEIREVVFQRRRGSR